jgi:hypothetical protein
LTIENAVETNVIVSEPLEEPSGFCTECHSATLFMFDKEQGYYKQCPNCGNIQYLHRRFLRFDRQSRQWK